MRLKHSYPRSMNMSFAAICQKDRDIYTKSSCHGPSKLSFTIAVFYIEF